MMHAGDDGTVTVWIIALCALCMVVALGVARLGQATSGVTHIQNAADAAALSGAYEVAHSNSSQACVSARTAAQKNGASLIHCFVNEDEVVVHVSMKNDPDFTARARAEVE
ncbi:MAG TPA: pilus assembly protein TadG-related protein [Acidimicrobiia bacterium]|nr:pilus assembly protein TadG-related protein [Acidimicrobiia bacterium]